MAISTYWSLPEIHSEAVAAVQPLSRLETLSPEVANMIFQQLDPVDKMSLKLTSKDIAGYIPGNLNVIMMDYVRAFYPKRRPVQRKKPGNAMPVLVPASVIQCPKNINLQVRRRLANVMLKIESYYPQEATDQWNRLLCSKCATHKLRTEFYPWNVNRKPCMVEHKHHDRCDERACIDCTVDRARRPFNVFAYSAAWQGKDKGVLCYTCYAVVPKTIPGRRTKGPWKNVEVNTHGTYPEKATLCNTCASELVVEEKERKRRGAVRRKKEKAALKEKALKNNAPKKTGRKRVP